MWLFRKQMPVATAVLEVLRTVEPLPLRLRDRARPFGLHAGDAFELESLGLIHAVAVHAIETSRFDTTGRDRLQDAFSRLYADRMLRRRLTLNVFELRPPLEAAAANDIMRSLKLSPHDRLDLSNLQHFLVSRLSAYGQGDLEVTIETFLAYLEVPLQFDLMFSLAVFIADTTEAVRERLDSLNDRVYLV
jgi:hypothetical protein